MIVFHSDLDNTLIYSYKHDIGAEKICVEYYNGKPLSFMRPEWVDALKRIQERVLFVPTTTRTVEQYQRISMGINTPEYALVCNGGILLKAGERDRSWYEQSLRLVSDTAAEMEHAMRMLAADEALSMEVRFIERLFLFTKSNEPDRSIARLRAALEKSRVNVYSNGNKVYVVPEKLSKGEGVMRLKAMLGAELVLAAGDSEFDKPMLLAADLGMCPEGLLPDTQSSVLQFPSEEFTGKLLARAEEAVLTKLP